MDDLPWWTVVIAFSVGVVVMFLLTEVKQKCYLSGDSYDTMQNHIKTLTRQAARWSVASTQDESPMVAVLHANYGAGYLWALKDIATDQQISSATGIDIPKRNHGHPRQGNRQSDARVPRIWPKGGRIFGQDCRRSINTCCMTPRAAPTHIFCNNLTTGKRLFVYSCFCPTNYKPQITNHLNGGRVGQPAVSINFQTFLD